MAEFTFDQLMRTGHVKRWQIVRVAREQTIAEHMYRVWACTQYLCNLLRVPEDLTEVALTWALVHDLPEVVTGDIATPAKEAMREALPHDDPVRRIELELSESYKEVWGHAKEHRHEGWPSAYEIVKICDLIEAKCFLGCEKIGNHAQLVYEEMSEKVAKMFADLERRYPTEPDWHRAWEMMKDSWGKV